MFKFTRVQTSLQRAYLISQVFHEHLQQRRLLAIDPARTCDHSCRNPEKTYQEPPQIDTCLVQMFIYCLSLLMLLALFLNIVIQCGSGWHDVIAALLEVLSDSCAATVDCVSSSSDS